MGKLPQVFGHAYGSKYSETLRGVFDYRCLDEQTIAKISQTIRSKPQWRVVEVDRKRLERVRQELKQQGPVKAPRTGLNIDDEDDGEMKDEVIEYALSELEYYKFLEDDLAEGRFVPSVVDEHIFLGEQADLKLRDQLRALVETQLETMPKDWHPQVPGGESTEQTEKTEKHSQVLDLVHPSLYPLQYGVTPVLAPNAESIRPLELGLDRLAECRPIKEAPEPYKSNVEQWGISENFQWLPSLFDISADGHVSIGSYINNLHPVHKKELYEPIASVFAKAIPGINACLSIFATPDRRPIPKLSQYTFYDYPLSGGDLAEKLGDDGIDELYEDDDPDAYFRARGKPFHNKPVWKGMASLNIDQVETRGSQLKVITKLANIHLTPENPHYQGGSWHLEGQINEDIIATVLYYYDSDNITDSQLAFRRAHRDPPYEQSDHYGVRKVFGITGDEESLTSTLGSVPCEQDSMLIFPNCFQHRVQPFSLADATKSGHRKILCFFICDPTDPNVVATDRVPAQQREWWSDEVLQTGALNKLPPELVDSVMSSVEWPMDFETAKDVRIQLMKERSATHFDDYEHPFDSEFSLCEH